MADKNLPVTRSPSLAYTLSLIVALLMAVASLAGLFFPAALYPSPELRRTFVSNDAVNLFIGWPSLLGSLWLARRGTLIGLLFWPGALFYVLYNSIAYAVATLMTVQFFVYVALVALSAFIIFRLMVSLDAPAIQRSLAGAAPVRLGGGVLVGLGTLFCLRAIGQLLGGQVTAAEPEWAVLVADLLTTPFWVVGGILLWRRQALGYAVGLGLLFQGSMLFVALLVFFILQPFLTGTPFPLTDFVVIFVMGLVCFVPFGLFVRGARNAGR